MMAQGVEEITQSFTHICLYKYEFMPFPTLSFINSGQILINVLLLIYKPTMNKAIKNH